jgi:hypothetical protein
MEGRSKNELAAVTESVPAERKPVNSTNASAGWARDERRFKVFISYSRRDSAAYAERLVGALEAWGLAAKLDHATSNSARMAATAQGFHPAGRCCRVHCVSEVH